MRTLNLILLSILLITVSSLSAQEVLPKVSVKNVNGKIIISWKNNYTQSLKTINIQRSFDSLKYYSTIGTVMNPANTENGYVDQKPPYNKMYYKLFIVFDSGQYIFTPAYKPVIDTVKIIPKAKETVITIPTVPPPSPVSFVPSKYIYTAKDNNVVISVPLQNSKKFSVKFFDENDVLLFQIKEIKEPYLILEKVNFKHSGWFYYSLYEGEELFEKHKFFIPKETYKKPANNNWEQGK